jgi:Mn-dependent DtxR family transcriptional regulator
MRGKVMAQPARASRPVSSSAEHYLRAVLELRDERGYARVVEIATRVGVTKGTVSIALSQLRARGLIRFDAARFPVLTPESLRRGRPRRERALVEPTTSICGRT